MKRSLIVAAVLLTISHGASAEWIAIDSGPRHSSFLWNPVEHYFPYAYPIVAVVYNKPAKIAGWKYKARSARSKSIVDCRDGRLNVSEVIAFSGRNLNSKRVKLAWFVLSNGLKVKVRRWYAYHRLPAATQQLINSVCSL